MPVAVIVSPTRPPKPKGHHASPQPKYPPFDTIPRIHLRLPDLSSDVDSRSRGPAKCPRGSISRHLDCPAIEHNVPRNRCVRGLVPADSDQRDHKPHRWFRDCLSITGITANLPLACDRVGRVRSRFQGTSRGPLAANGDRSALICTRVGPVSRITRPTNAQALSDRDSQAHEMFDHC